MKDKGLNVLFNSAFSGIPTMLNGKSCREEMRGFRMVVTLLLVNNYTARSYRDVIVVTKTATRRTNKA